MNVYDLAYTAGLLIASPVWATRSRSRNKVLKAMAERMGYVPPVAAGGGPVVVIHAVSLGEMNATRAMVTQLLARRPELRIVVSTTTDTGYDRGRQLCPAIGPVRVVRFPLDFSSAVNRFLDRLHADVVVLMELEIWPNFLLQCQRRGIPAVLVNGRMTPSAYARYRRVRPVTARMFRRLNAICAQEASYAKCFIALGAPADRVTVAGTMKFDTAEVTDRVEGDVELAATLGIDVAAGPVWVCGSTGPGEEALLLDVYRSMLATFPTLRLILVPRKPERFDDVAARIADAGFGVLRRSGKPGATAAAPTVILGDTLGELRTFYSLATVVFVGRSLVDLGPRQHGSDMIEPAALAKPVAVGPFTHNFAEPMRLLREGNGVVQVDTVERLQATLADWLTDADVATEIGRRAQQVVRDNQGATARHVDSILNALAVRTSSPFSRRPAELGKKCESTRNL